MSVLEPIFIGLEDAAAFLGCGRTTFYKLIKDGDIRAVKQGRRTLIRTQSLREYAASLPDIEPTPPS
jgi:excisionase family DNA binding protein